MSCSIEALQSKAKLRDARQREFQRKVLWPEFKPRETETIIDSATYRMKAIVESALAKIRGAIGTKQLPPPTAQCDASSVNSQGEDEEDDEEGVDVNQDANDEGFLEVIVTKKN